MRRNLMLTVIVAAGMLLGLSACTPEQVALYNTLSPEDQQVVVVELQRQQAETQFYLGILAAQQRESIQMNPFLTCVRHHESDRGPFPHTNGYGAENPISSASGAYQFIDGTWRSAAASAGESSYGGHAAWAPPDVQDRVAYHTAITLGQRYHWNGTGC